MNIIYEDSDIIICYKEAGLPVQSSSLRSRDLTDILRMHLQKDGKEPYLGIVHRLDQPVRGLVAFAKNAKAASDLSAQVTNGKMKKIYTALVRKADANADHLLANNGTLTDFLKKDAKTNTSGVVSAKDPAGKKAVLEYEVTELTDEVKKLFPEAFAEEGKNSVETKTAEDCGEAEKMAEGKQDRACGMTALRIHLLTGRHHQIRVQLSHAGMPIIGDHKYGHDMNGDPKFPCLCASELELDHPRTGKRMHFSLDQ